MWCLQQPASCCAVSKLHHLVLQLPQLLMTLAVTQFYFA
jgi:hypothetical protein